MPGTCANFLEQKGRMVQRFRFQDEMRTTLHVASCLMHICDIQYIYNIYIYNHAHIYIDIVYHSCTLYLWGRAWHDTIRTCQALFLHQALHNPGQVAKPCAGTFGRIDGEFRPCHGIAGLGSRSGLRDERLKKTLLAFVFF